MVDSEFATKTLAVALREQHRNVGDLGQQIEVGCETGDRAVEEHHVLDVEHQFLGHARAVAEHRLHDTLHFLHQLFARQGGGVDHGRAEIEVLDHGLDVGVHRQRTEVAQRFHLSRHVVGGGIQHQSEESHATRSGEATDDAEVEQRGLAVLLNEEVPAVQVAVEDAVDHRAFHERDHSGADHGLGIDTGFLHADHVVELEPAESLHHEHSSGDERGVWARNHVAVLLEFLQHLGDVEHVARFDPEVEFLDDGLGEQLHECRRVGECRHLDSSDEVGGEPCHHTQVLAHQLGDDRSLHLHDHFFTGAQRGHMHLGDRCGGER